MIAAEPSSSLYAQRLLEEWKAQGLSVEAFGIGSVQMEALGFECIGRTEELAVMGLAEIMGSIGKIVDVFYKLVRIAQERKPDVVILLDYPEFNFRLAKKLKKLGFKIVYYISPQIWAWRSGRVHFIKKYIDKVLVLFPFEVDFYKKYGVDVDFVGHPLLDELSPKIFTTQYQNEQRGKYGVVPGEKVLALMPGSRRSELKLHMETQIRTAALVLEKLPKAKIMLLVAPNLSVEEIRSYLPKEVSLPVIFVKKDPFEMIAMSDFVLCASGTATLAVGLMEKPMVIMYIFKKMTAFLAQFLIKRPTHFGMSNLILGKTVSPEFFQDEASPKSMSSVIVEQLSNPQIYKVHHEELMKLKAKLGDTGATKKVSKILLSMRKL